MIFAVDDIEAMREAADELGRTLTYGERWLDIVMGAVRLVPVADPIISPSLMYVAPPCAMYGSPWKRRGAA